MTTSATDQIESAPARVSICKDDSGLTISVKQRHNLLSAVPAPFICVVLIWATVPGIEAAIETLTYEGFDAETRIASALIQLMAVGFGLLLAAVIAVLGLWILFGEEEFYVGEDHVSARVNIGLYEWRRDYEIANLDDVFYKLRVLRAVQPFFPGANMRLYAFQWRLLFGGRISGGAVGLMLGRKTRYFGANLDEQQAQAIIRAIRSACPHLGSR